MQMKEKNLSEVRKSADSSGTGDLCRSPCPYFLLPSAHIHPNARSVNTHTHCVFVDVLLCPFTHTYIYAKTVYAHHLLIFTLCLWLYTHSPLLPSLISLCLQSRFSICFSFCVFCTLHFYSYPPLPLNFFLFDALWFEQRQSSKRQVNSLFTAESSSGLRALLILGSLWYFHLRWSHLGCQPHVTLSVGGRVHYETLLKERMSGQVCTYWETSSHAFCVGCECLHL